MVLEAGDLAPFLLLLSAKWLFRRYSGRYEMALGTLNIWAKVRQGPKDLCESGLLEWMASVSRLSPNYRSRKPGASSTSFFRSACLAST